MNREQAHAKYTNMAMRTAMLTREQHRNLTDDDHTARMVIDDPAWATKHDADRPPPVVQLGQGRSDPGLGEPWKWPTRMAAWFGVRLAFAYGVIEMCVAVGGCSR